MDRKIKELPPVQNRSDRYDYISSIQTVLWVSTTAHE